MGRPRPWHVLLGLFVAALIWPHSGDGQVAAPPAGEWRSYGNNERSTRYSPLDLITRENVQNLQVAWTWKFDNFGSPAETVTTPTTTSRSLPATRAPGSPAPLSSRADAVHAASPVSTHAAT